MARNLNKVQLIGNVGQDPEIRTTASGTNVAHVSLATNRRISRNGEADDYPAWRIIPRNARHVSEEVAASGLVGEADAE